MSSEEEFRLQGYSKNSLEMLKTTEGQLNAVFACFGSAAQHGQYFEKALGEFIVKIKHVLEPATPAEHIQSAKSQLARKTIGQLLQIMGKHVQPDAQWVTDLLLNAHKSRNFLIHHYFIEREDRFKTASGRTAMLKELLSIQEQIERATVLVDGMRFAVTERVLNRDSDSNESERALFSIEISINETKKTL